MSNANSRHLIQQLRGYLSEVTQALQVDQAGTRALDRVGDLVMTRGGKLLEQLAGEKEPETAKERKQRRILEAATALFIEQGYRKTSMGEVASRAAVAKGTVYLYFDSKADLLLHAIALEKARFVGGAMAILTGSLPPREKLRLYLRELFILINEMPLVGRLVAGDREMLAAVDDMGMGPVSAIDAQAAFFGFLVRRAVGVDHYSRDELDRRCHVLVGLMYSAGFMADEQLRGGITIEQYATTLADMLVDGLVPPGASVSDPTETAGGSR